MISTGKYQQFIMCRRFTAIPFLVQRSAYLQYVLSGLSQCKKKKPKTNRKKAIKNIYGNRRKISSFPTIVFLGHFNVASKMPQPLAMLVFCTLFFHMTSPLCYIPLGQINPSSHIPYALSTALVYIVLWGSTQYLSLY